MDFNLVSCNIRFDNPHDGDNAWIFRREFLAKTLLKHSPTIIATQEGRESQLCDFLSLLPHFAMATNHRPWIQERMYPTIYFDRTKIELLESGDQWLSTTPDIAGSKSFESAFPRLMTWGLFNLKRREKKILVVNTHLDHIKEETRSSQIDVLISCVKKIIRPDHSLVLLGDFNTTPQSDVRRKIIDAFPHLIDTWRIFNPIEEASFHSFTGNYEHDMRIDWILADKELKVQNSFMDRRMTEGEKFPSDHFPVIAKFKV